jgi:hypothetical protein
MRLISRWRDNAVDAALQETVGEEGQRVGDVDGDRAGVGFYPFPFSGWRSDLFRIEIISKRKSNGRRNDIQLTCNAATG